MVPDAGRVMAAAIGFVRRSYHVYMQYIRPTVHNEEKRKKKKEKKSGEGKPHNFLLDIKIVNQPLKMQSRACAVRNHRSKFS